jgi:hypothetical protein
MWLVSVREKLAAVRAAAATSAPCAKACASFELKPPLAAGVFASFEQDLGVRLPDDYRTFMNEVASGGNGPSIELFSVGEINFGYGSKRWKKDGEHVHDPASPFPYATDWNWDRARIEALSEDTSGTLEAEYWAPVDGAIPIAADSSYQIVWLVVTGPEAGRVWHDSRNGYGGWGPWLDDKDEHRTFAGWVEAWLDAALAPRRFARWTWRQGSARV